MTTPTSDIHVAIVTKSSLQSVANTVEKFLHLLEMKQLTLFAVIDQRAAALSVGLDLRETTLVIFGNPLAGTRVMEVAPLAALELPLKILIWADGVVTKVSYLSPGALAERFQLPSDLAATLAGIDALTDALVAEESTPYVRQSSAT
jgi:uncharacterized protein (DUF302 family)